MVNSSKGKGVGLGELVFKTDWKTAEGLIALLFLYTKNPAIINTAKIKMGKRGFMELLVYQIPNYTH